jgi:HK97 family phage portal protein
MAKSLQLIQRLVDKTYNYIYARQTSETKYPGESRTPVIRRTASGLTITPDIGLLNDTAWACRRYLSQSVGLLPARILQDKGSVSPVVYNHPVDKLLNYRPNSELAPFQLRETLTSWAITHGNGVAEIERDLVGRVINLWPIEPWRLFISRYGDNNELVYKVDMGAGKEPVLLESSDVLHIRGFGNGAVGISVMEYAAQTIGWAKATEIFGASFFSRGLHFGGTAIFKENADGDQIEAAQTRLEDAFSGASNNSKWFIGDGDMQITRMSATPNESQFIETLQFQVESICRWFGVPPHKVMHLLRATFTNIESQSIEVVTDSIAPWALRWEQECSFKLFGQNRTNLKVEFDLKGMLRGAYKDRQEGLQVQRRNGIINADEWRALEGQGPVEGGSGKIYVIEKNMIPLHMIEDSTQAGIDNTGNNNNQQTDPNQTNTDPGSGSGSGSSNDNQAAQARAILAEFDINFKLLEEVNS